MSVVILLQTCIYNAVKLPRHFKYSTKHVYIDYILRSTRFRCYVESRHSIGINSRFTQQCNVVFYVYADLCILLAANCQFSILIGQKMQLTGCHNGNEMRNATCVDTKISIEWPYCSFLYCGLGVGS